LRRIGKLLAIGFAALLALVGGLALATGLAPENPSVVAARDAVFEAALRLSVATGQERLSDWVSTGFASVFVQYGFPPAALVLLVLALLPGRARTATGDDDEPQAEPVEQLVLGDKKTQKKAVKQATALARAGRHLEAAELCFHNGRMEEAATFYVEAGELIRAAEIRHDQKRFVESAELYMQAGSHDSAGAIYAQHEEWSRAAEAYIAAGTHSVAAEMYEKAEDWPNAAQSYEKSEFPRHAAKAWVRCGQWMRAADCLEQVIVENMSSAGPGDTKKQAETRKLVRMAGDLFSRAGADDRAQQIYERGECWSAAAEIALRIGEREKAADLFLRAHEAPRAAEVLKGLGRDEESARVLAEYHRDRGEDEQAATCFEAAGDHMAAGDLYRLLEQYERAAECYGRYGEHAQAAEMFSSAGDRARAAECYERAGMPLEAAEAWSLAGDAEREAECLTKAGEGLRAGLLYQQIGDEEAAIKALQQIGPEQPGFTQASTLLGEIFRKRGMLSLAQTKLSQVVSSAELSRENIDAFYGLAMVHEANESHAEALVLFEKILAFDYHHSDVAARVAHCKERVQGQSGRNELSTPASGSQADGRYRIVGKLGRGGMGIVYKAQDTVLDRTVAFKVLPETLKENPQSLKNFLREAKSAAQLNHPNIVTIFDTGEQDGVYYIAMEYVDGNTLKEIVKARGKVSAGGIVHVLAQMCEALAYAHENKIVHRDIKTANTMWTKDRKAKIMDFGLAKVIEEVRNHTTVVSGTPYYMSPEQTLGKNVDHRTDIYSLGVTIFELATGTLPFMEGNLPYHHVHTPAPDPLELTPELPSLLREIILRCLEKDPADRFASTREILDELKRSLKA